jgi:glycerol transport system ATP-binding protein
LPSWAKKGAGLTADQKQKISLGRGLVRSDVNAILFDEPLTVIDPHMKWVLRSQLKQLHRQFGYTMVYVTHDQTEALTFADKVVVMYDGQIVQIGTPAELFEKPKHTFVGYFHRLAGHECAAGRGRGQQRAASANQTLDLGFAPKIAAGRRPNSASARNSSARRARACRSRSTRSRISAARRSCAPHSPAARSPSSCPEDDEIPPIRA